MSAINPEQESPNLNNNNSAVSFFRRKKAGPNDDFGLLTLKAIMGIGILGIIASALIFDAKKGFLQICGLSLLVALASAMAGGIMGFLFGIPKSLQKDNSDSTFFANNTNLEQISDWLTKIIVGVSLTQLPEIEKRLNNLTQTISLGFNKYMDSTFSFPYSGALVTFYVVSGFIYVYLWCIIYLRNQLNTTLVAKIKAVETTFEKASSLNSINIELAKIDSQISSFYKQRNTISIAESLPAFKDIVEKAKPLPVTFLDDCQKNRWGGMITNNEYQISADIVSKKPEDSNDETFLVTMKVSQINPSVISQFTVYFFLHDTYASDLIKKIESENGIASLEVPSYEAFTVGAYVEQADVKLELDLNLYEKSPDEYKYKDTLITITELVNQKKKLEESTSTVNQ